MHHSLILNSTGNSLVSLVHSIHRSWTLNLIVDRFQINNTLIYSHRLLYNCTLIMINTFFHLRVSCCITCIDTVSGNYQKSKEIATDSNHLKCHALLVALHFPSKTTSFERFWVHWGCRPKRKFTSWAYQINFIHTWCYMNSVNFAKQNKIVKYNKTETDGLLKIRELCGGQRSISLTFYDNSLLLFNLRNLSILGSFTLT